jgi:hypothetical protein
LWFRRSGVRVPSLTPLNRLQDQGVAAGKARVEIGDALLKDARRLVDATAMGDDGSRLPTAAGPVPDRMTIWPVDDGRYGLDATFFGASGYERADWHVCSLSDRGVRHKFLQEPNGAWTVRLGPLTALDVGSALGAFVR